MRSGSADSRPVSGQFCNVGAPVSWSPGDPFGNEEARVGCSQVCVPFKGSIGRAVRYSPFLARSSYPRPLLIRSLPPHAERSARGNRPGRPGLVYSRSTRSPLAFLRSLSADNPHLTSTRTLAKCTASGATSSPSCGRTGNSRNGSRSKRNCSGQDVRHLYPYHPSDRFSLTPSEETTVQTSARMERSPTRHLGRIESPRG